MLCFMEGKCVLIVFSKCHMFLFLFSKHEEMLLTGEKKITLSFLFYLAFFIAEEPLTSVGQPL